MASRVIKIILEEKGSKKVATSVDKVTKSVKNVTSAVSLSRMALKRLKKSQKDAAESARKLERANKGLTNQFIKVNLASRGISRGINLLTSAISYGITSAISFEFTIAKIGAISGIAGKNLLSLENTIRDIAKESPKTGTEVAQAALEMSKMGLAGKDLEQALAGVVGLSVALDEEVSTVGQTMVSVKNVFKEDASELTNIADKMFTTLGNSALNLEKFSTAFAYAGSSAKLAGVSFEELSAMMGVLADNGIKASTIGTQLRQVFTKLDDPTSKVSKLLGAQSLKTKGLGDTLRSLIPVLNDSGDAKRLFGQRAIAVINILTKNIGKVEALKTETENMTKRTDDASKALGNTMHGQVTKLSSAWLDLNTQIAKTIDAPVKLGLEGISALIKGMTTLLQGGGKEAQKIGNLRLQAATGNIGPAPIKKEKPFGFTGDDARKEQQLLRKTNKEIANDKIIADAKIRISKINTLKIDLEGIAETNKLEAARAEHAGKTLNIKSQIAELEGKLATSISLEDTGTEAIALNQIIALKREQKSLDDAAQKALEDSRKKDLSWFADAMKINKASKKEQAEKAEVMKKMAEQAAEWQKRELELDLERTIGFQSALLGINTLSSAVDTLGQSLTDLAFGGNLEEWGNAWKAFAKQMIADLVKMAIRLLIVKSLTSLLGIGTGGVGFAGAGTVTSLLLGSLGGVDTTNPSPKASGFNGTVSQPTTFTVGEEGAEEVMIKPRSQANGKASAGATVNINVSGDINGEEQFIQRLNRGLEELDRRTV